MPSDLLSSARVETDLDARAFTEFTIKEGWGDGLPCLPPTEVVVRGYLAAIERDPQDVVAVLPPLHGICTVEKVAVNAAMTGMPPAAMGLLCAAIEAMTDDDFNLASLNATTAPVAPIIIVNGEIRNHLDVPCGSGCFGGAPGSGASIGRALRLVLRNIAGQEIGVTSMSCFGQPARVSGLVVGEWEEESPWRPLAERRGVPGDAVTVFATMGTANIVDTVAQEGGSLVQILGKSLAYIGANGFVSATGSTRGEVVVAVNPVWAKEILARDVGSVRDVQAALWEHAALPIDAWPADYRGPIEDLGRVERDGRVHVVASPDDVIVVVCGGRVGLHGAMLHGFGRSYAATVAVRP
jgi:hypothetical protein